MSPAPDAEHAQRARRPVVEDVLVTLAALVAAVSVVVRLVGLARQSYWVDELFSVTQASGSPANLWRMGSTEVHPPVFAALAWVWEHAGHSLRPGWMRLLPALFGAAVPAVTYAVLRRPPLHRLHRAVLVAATSACGLGLVYAQEMRSYSPLFLTAIGVTGASLRVLASRRGDDEPAALRAWTAWSFGAAALHLFGGLLAAATALLLVRGRTRPDRRPVWRALVLAELPQVLWIVPGAFRPGFSRGAGWIQAPRPRDAWLLLTSTFGTGRLSLRADGFPLAAPWGVLALAVVAAIALLLGRRDTPAATADAEPGAPTRAQLGLLARLVTWFAAGLFVASQLLHLWTLRNMIVLAPALVWLVVLGVLELARTGRQRQLVAALLLGCSAAQLLGTTHAMRAPYKSQFAQSMERAAQLRAQYPALQVRQSGVDAQWLYASSLPATDVEFAAVMGSAARVVDPASEPAAPVGVPTLYLVYTSTHSPSAPVDAVLLQHNRSGCHAEAFVSVAFVFCAP